jgi:hypothetical protein
MYRMIAAVVLGMAIAPLQAAVVGKEVSYQAGDTVMKGYLAYDDAVTGKRPGILVVHEWWGHNTYARKRAEMLAELGYTAMARQRTTRIMPASLRLPCVRTRT